LSCINQIEITGKEIVVQHNTFLDSPKNLTLQEYKLFMFLVSKIDPINGDFSVFRVTALEFAKAIGVENSTYIYRDLQAVTLRLMTRVVKIHRTEDQLLIQTHLLDSVHYWYGEGYVDIKISDDMKPYLLNLKREFTQYKLSQIIKLSSVYAIKIYELLKKQEGLGKRTIFIDDLRKKLSIQDNHYKKINDLKLRVLEISKREINLKTDLKIDFEFIKTGRKVTAVQFDIKPKNEKTKKQKGLCCVNNEKDPRQVREIMQFGYSASQAMDMLDYVDNLDAENAIKAVKSQIKKGNAKNPKAMIKTALKEKWSNDEGDSSRKNNETKIKKPTSRKMGFMKIFEYFFTK
jgi:plasmid replication initiation protein